MIKEMVRSVKDIQILDDRIMCGEDMIAHWGPTEVICLDYQNELHLRLQTVDIDGRENQITLPFRYFGALGTFNNHSMTCDLGFYGTEGQLKMLGKSLMERAGEHIEATDIVGSFHDKWTDWNDTQFYSAGTHSLYKKLEIGERKNPELLKEVLPIFSQSKEISRMTTRILGWIGACPFATQIRERLELFPILNVVGEQGSGKTDLVSLFIKMFGWKGDLESWGVSEYVLTRFMSSTNAFPICFDEFTNTDWKIQLLKLVPKGAKWTKGNWTSGPSQVQLDLVSPVCLVGENSIESPAVRERTMVVSLKKIDRLEISMWSKAVDIASRIDLSDYMKWACEQKLPDTIKVASAVKGEGGSTAYERTKIELSRIHRELTGQLVVNIGLEMLEKYFESFNAELNLSRIPIERESIEAADDVLVFLNILLRMYETKQLNKWHDELHITTLLEPINNVKKECLLFKMSDIWSIIKQEAGRINIEVKSERDLNTMLRTRKEYCYGQKQRMIYGKKTLAWCIDLDEVSKRLSVLRGDFS